VAVAAVVVESDGFGFDEGLEGSLDRPFVHSQVRSNHRRLFDH